MTEKGIAAPAKPRADGKGLTLVELLVVTLLLAGILASVVSTFHFWGRTQAQEDLVVATEQNLRLGLGIVADHLRRANYRVPPPPLTAWVPWVPGLDASPKVTQGASGAPDRLRVASCTPVAATTLAAPAGAGDTTVRVLDTAAFDTDRRRLIVIGEREYAHVVAIGAGSLTVDTLPATAGVNDGLVRAHGAGTPVCRVDVRHFTLEAGALQLDEEQGSGPRPIAEAITDFQVTASGRSYVVTLTARSEKRAPIRGDFFFRSLSSRVTLRN